MTPDRIFAEASAYIAVVIGKTATFLVAILFVVFTIFGKQIPKTLSKMGI